jgi:hypothetical protein
LTFAEEFIEMINKWNTLPKEITDDELSIQILQDEIDLIKNPPMKYPPKHAYFSPSSSDSMQRELVVKVRKFPKDPIVKQPYTKRWQDSGTFYGGYIQRIVLFCEKHYKEQFGVESPFYFERIYLKEHDREFPSFETAIKKSVGYEYRDHKIYIFGQGDGILIHRATGTRIILEVKSKQTSYSATGHFSMKEPTGSHVKQVIAYSLQHQEEERPINHGILFYGNLAKKAWTMTEEDVEKYPDIRTFDIDITEEKQVAVLDHFADVLDHVNAGTLPPVDLDKWLFCNFKEVITDGLTDEEFAVIKEEVKAIQKTKLPDYKKNPYIDAFFYIKDRRKENAAT